MAPFPDAGHRASTRAFPLMVPSNRHADGAAISRAAKTFWQTQWEGATLMAIGLQDPVFGPAVMEQLRVTLGNCQDPIRLAEAGHFVQEHGHAIAQSAVSFFNERGVGSS